jgi:hypothetical protein
LRGFQLDGKWEFEDFTESQLTNIALLPLERIQEIAEEGMQGSGSDHEEMRALETALKETQKQLANRPSSLPPGVHKAHQEREQKLNSRIDELKGGRKLSEQELAIRRKELADVERQIKELDTSQATLAVQGKSVPGYGKRMKELQETAHTIRSFMEEGRFISESEQEGIELMERDRKRKAAVQKYEDAVARHKAGTGSVDEINAAAREARIAHGMDPRPVSEVQAELREQEQPELRVITPDQRTYTQEGYINSLNAAQKKRLGIKEGQTTLPLVDSSAFRFVPEREDDLKAERRPLPPPRTLEEVLLGESLPEGSLNDLIQEEIKRRRDRRYKGTSRQTPMERERQSCPTLLTDRFLSIVKWDNGLSRGVGIA